MHTQVIYNIFWYISEEFLDLISRNIIDGNNPENFTEHASKASSCRFIITGLGDD